MAVRDTYLGNGVYASFDGFYIWLDTREPEPVNRIALKPSVLEEFDEFRKQVDLEATMKQYFHKRPVIVEAYRWFKNGDHEGKIVHRFRWPDIDGGRVCNCGSTMNAHGWIDTANGGSKVCPGDWIVTDPRSGDIWPVKPAIFEATYEPYEPVAVQE